MDKIREMVRECSCSHLGPTDYPRPQMILRPEMIPKLDRKYDPEPQMIHDVDRN